MFYKMYRHFNINQHVERFQILSTQYSRTVLATDWDGKNIYECYCSYYLLIDWNIIQLVHTELKGIKAYWLNIEPMYFETIDEFENFYIKMHS